MKWKLCFSNVLHIEDDYIFLHEYQFLCLKVCLLTCWEIMKWKLCFSSVMHIQAKFVYTNVKLYV